MRTWLGGDETLLMIHPWSVLIYFNRMWLLSCHFVYECGVGMFVIRVAVCCVFVDYSLCRHNICKGAVVYLEPWSEVYFHCKRGGSVRSFVQMMITGRGGMDRAVWQYAISAVWRADWISGVV